MAICNAGGCLRCGDGKALRCLMLTLELEPMLSGQRLTADEDYFVGMGRDSTLPRQHQYERYETKKRSIGKSATQPVV
jgi:hypothetical protein